MFLAKYNDLIVYVAERQEDILNSNGFNYTEIIETQDEYTLENGQYIKVDAEYLKQKRLKEIEKELDALDVQYTSKLDTPVIYSANGFTYKPKYAQETYISLLTAGQIMPLMFPIKIWDSTELEAHAVDMPLAELTNLTVFLAGIQQGYFNERKQAKALLQKEKEELSV